MRCDRLVGGVTLVAMALMLGAAGRGYAKDEESRALSAEQARLLIERSVPFEAGSGLAFAETVDHASTSGSTALRVRYEWKARGDLYAGQCYLRIVRHAEPAIHVKRDGNRLYTVVMRGNHWEAKTTGVGLHDFPTISGYMRRLQPFGSEAWPVSVSQRPIADAHVRTDGRLVVTFVPSSSVADALAGGGTVSGFVGWRCTFGRHEAGYDLVQVEQLASLSTTGGSASGDSVPNAELLTGSDAREVVLLGKTYGVRAVTTLAEYVSVGAIRLPLSHEHLSWRGRTVSRIDATSVREEVLGEDVFSFVPPEECGVNGIALDERGGGRYYGDVAPDKDRLLDSLVERRGGSRGLPDSWIGVMGALGAVGVAMGVVLVRLWRKTVRRRLS